MKRTLLLIAVMLLAVRPLPAGSGGSAYSIFGIGDIRSLPTFESAGRGYTGLGFASTSGISTLSPATWVRINRVRLELGMLLEGFSSSDGEKSLYRGSANFSGALLALPIAPAYGVVIAGGFVPYSNISFNTYTRGSQENTEYIINHVGGGGLGRGFLGFSYAPARWLSFGATMDYIFGSLEREEKLIAIPVSGLGGVTSRTEQSITTSGFTGTGSLYFSGFGFLSEALGPLTLGLTLTPGTGLSTRAKTAYVYPQESDTTGELEGELGIPLSYGAGVTWGLSDRSILLADYYAQQWADTRVNGAAPASLRNSRRVGIGFERLPAEERGSTWWDRLSLRAGAAYNATYYYVNATGIDEWSVTAGAGFPLFGEARLHLGAEYSWRGSTDNGLISDGIFRLHASLSISELWFVRYQED